MWQVTAYNPKLSRSYIILDNTHIFGIILDNIRNEYLDNKIGSFSIIT